MPDEKSHTLRIQPRISASHLADFMAATFPVKRTIVRDSKFVSRARVMQHNEAKSTIAKFIRDTSTDPAWLTEEEQRLRARIADKPFDRDLYDYNADYIARFAKVQSKIMMPSAERLPPGKCPPIVLHGVTVTMDIQFRLRRVTKTNKPKDTYPSSLAQREAVANSEIGTVEVGFATEAWEAGLASSFDAPEKVGKRFFQATKHLLLCRKTISSEALICGAHRFEFGRLVAVAERKSSSRVRLNALLQSGVIQVAERPEHFGQRRFLRTRGEQAKLVAKNLGLYDRASHVEVASRLVRDTVSVFSAGGISPYTIAVPVIQHAPGAFL